MSRTVLVTGSAGFIGYFTSQALLAQGWNVIGLDAMTDYYDVKLKKRRHEMLSESKNFTAVTERLETPGLLRDLFEQHKFDPVIHLAAQAGVRYSIDAPRQPRKTATAINTKRHAMTFNRSLKIAPSILAADFANFGAECEAIEAQGADWVHVDVMDGHFVPNITFGPATCAAIRPHIKGVMDVHLMISPVDSYIEAFAESGADVITAHVEATPHIHRTMQAIRANGAKAGIALNPATPASSIEYLLDIVDLVCVMTVNPGFGGQKFIHSQIEKVRQIRSMIGDRPIHIEIDGGVDPTTAPLVANAGADVLVAGSAVFRGGSVSNPAPYGENIRNIRAAAVSVEV